MSWEMSEAPHISQDRREGWLAKVHRGQWKEASGSELRGGVVRPGDCGEVRSEICFGLTGSGVWRAGLDGPRVDALLIAAFRTWVRVGLMPHAKHGGRGV